MEIENLRTYFEGKIKLCEHITIDGVIKPDEGCEYIETITITCNECKKEHSVSILIN